MIKIDDEFYYVDFSVITEELEKDEDLGARKQETSEVHEEKDANGKVFGSKTITYFSEKPKEVDGLKYQMISNFLEIVLSEPNEFSEEKMKISLAKCSASFAIAFNTLLKLKVIKTINI